MNSPQEFAQLLAALRKLPAEGAALATLTRTSGSTFRHAGARMLVYPDGKVVCSLAGGCPERDIALHAKAVIASGIAQRLRYNRQQNFDAMLEMGCGGELEVLVEPIREPADCAFAEVVNQCLLERNRGVLATVLAHQGACLPRPRRFLSSRSSSLNEIVDHRLAAAIADRMSQLPHGFKPTVEFISDHEVLFEELLPPSAAYLVGSNATSYALAKLLLRLGWQVTIIDGDKTEQQERAVEQFRHVSASPGRLLSALNGFDSRSFAVVMTHNLERDIDYLRELAGARLKYLGAIGSRQRVQKIRSALGDVSLHAPAGLNIGAETPEEIAMSIASEMLAVANGHDGGFLSRSAAALHH